MEPERWKQIERIYHEALKLEPDQRKSFLDQSCAGDKSLYWEVDVLLRGREEAGDFIQSPAIEVLARKMAADSPPIGESDNLIGRMLGNFEITSQIGRGGMGEVYRARDRKLGREVAIKVLPDEFAGDTDRVSRFEREARLLASLNHPNIAAIHDLEESDGIHYLVMELIEGQTLADRIKSGPVTVKEALKLALQIAEALEAAHEKGVIHRDLKPSNIKITPNGKVKILDFGLAKTFSASREEGILQDSPTESAAISRQGLILGTAAYMSPEQARGKVVDKRTDIWSFGCILFEMMTGCAAFKGEDAGEILAAVIKGDVKLDAVSAGIHPRAREVLVRCLKKDLRERYPDMADARYELEQVLADPGGVLAGPLGATEPRRNLRSTLSWVAAVVLTAVIVGYAIWKLRAPEPPEVMRLEYELPEDVQGDLKQKLALSQDGSQFVYSTNKGIYIRSIGGADARIIPGSDEDAQNLFFSPNGQWIGYFSPAGQKLKKISVSGGTPIDLCAVANIVIDAGWYKDDTIVYSAPLDGGIMRVSSSGGIPEEIVTGITVYRSQLLPGGKSVMFSHTDKAWTVVQSLESGVRKIVSFDKVGSYLPATGHFIYGKAAESSLYAVPFDIDRLETTGSPVPLNIKAKEFVCGGGGSLIYAPVTATLQTPELSTLVWVDRDGREESLEAEPHDYRYVKISPDGTKVAVTVSEGDNEDIYIWDIARKNMTQFTFGQAKDGYPLWTPDGKSILFLSDRKGTRNTYIKAADGTGEVRLFSPLLDHRMTPFCWSGDGKALLLTMYGNSGMDIVMLSPEGIPKIVPLLQSKYEEILPTISPDGKWLAYVSSEEPGPYKTYVRPFPTVYGGLWKILINGSGTLRWSANGKELLSYNGQLTTTAVEIASKPILGKPRGLFADNRNLKVYSGNMGSVYIPWDIHRDGRFLMIKPSIQTDEESSEESASAGPRKIVIVTNWIKELKQKVSD